MRSPVLAATTVHVTLTDQMELKLETSSVKAGRVLFEVRNEAQGQPHEVIIAKLRNRDQTVSVAPGADRVDWLTDKLAGPALTSIGPASRNPRN